MTPREAFIKSFMADFETILPGHRMGDLYKDYFASLSDRKFEEMVTKIEEGNLVLPLYVPILKEAKMSTKRNLEIGKQWGHEFLQHLTLTDPVNPEITIVTPERYLVCDQFMVRQAQTLEDKQAIPKDVSHVDDLSGQVTGASKGSAITKPELHVLDFHQLESTIMELLKSRGGDMDAWNKMEQSILTTGHVKLDDVDDGYSRAKSTEMLEVWLKGAHFGNNATRRTQ